MEETDGDRLDADTPVPDPAHALGDDTRALDDDAKVDELSKAAADVVKADPSAADVHFSYGESKGPSSGKRQMTTEEQRQDAASAKRAKRDVVSPPATTSFSQFLMPLPASPKPVVQRMNVLGLNAAAANFYESNRAIFVRHQIEHISDIDPSAYGKKRVTLTLLKKMVSDFALDDDEGEEEEDESVHDDMSEEEERIEHGEEEVDHDYDFENQKGQMRNYLNLSTGTLHGLYANASREIKEVKVDIQAATPCQVFADMKTEFETNGSVSDAKTRTSVTFLFLMVCVCVLQKLAKRGLNLAINTSVEIEECKSSTDFMDAFVRAFLPVFESTCLLPARERALHETKLKIRRAIDYVTETDTVSKVKKAQKTANKKLQKLDEEVEAASVTRRSGISKSPTGKAIQALLGPK
jgi:hypothetical protein